MTAGSGMTGLRSGQLAAAAGVNPQTLRYYERRGLLAEPARTPGGHRIYPAEEVTLLRVIKAAQRLGFSLDEVAELVDAGNGRRGNGRQGNGRQGNGRRGNGRQGNGRQGDAGLQARAAAKLAEVEARIADLHVVAGTLRTALAAGCDDLVACAGEPCCPIPFDGKVDP
jgi:MerR family transcriptional regulator, mercuric resistance operon regulatory protein